MMNLRKNVTVHVLPLGHHLKYLVLIALLLMHGVCAAADLRSNINSWKKAFDVVSVENPYVQRVQNIFERLKRVVGKDVLLSELYILDSDNEPWAIALEDGNVVLSRGALDIVYGASLTSMEAKDAQIAFVLGHELNHIAKADFWHEQVYRSFVNRDARQELKTITDKDTRRRESELRADEDGFIYASLAGFNTRAIFSSIENETDFLQYWVRQTRTGLGKVNFSAKERSEFLTATLESMDEAVKIFQYGTRLAHFGFFAEARLLLDEFYRIYPSSQVLSNLGYVYLQLARQAMPIELSARYWFPFVLDSESGVPDVSRSLSFGISDEAKSYLLKAKTFLSESILQSDSNDNAIKNLAIAHLYLNEYGKARSVLETAITRRADDYQLISLMAIAVLEDSDVAEQRQADVREELLTLASQADAPMNLIYNTARLLDITEFNSLAVRFWQHIGRNLDKMPVVYQKLTCNTYRELNTCVARNANNVAQPWPWTPENSTGIQIGANVDSAEIRDALAAWSAPFNVNLSEPDIRIYEHPTGNSLLALDGVVTVITQKLHSFDFKQHLIDENSQHQQPPLTERQLDSDMILYSGLNWAAKTSNEQISEIWFADAVTNN